MYKDNINKMVVYHLFGLGFRYLIKSVNYDVIDFYSKEYRTNISRHNIAVKIDLILNTEVTTTVFQIIS